MSELWRFEIEKFEVSKIVIKSVSSDVICNVEHYSENRNWPIPNSF